MRYHQIRKMDIANGPGVRVSVFMQGCSFNCPGCFNPETHDFKGGKEFTEETVQKILDLCASDYIVGLSILGGEPMHPNNIEGTTTLAKAFKENYPEKTLWIWTGFLMDEYLMDKDILHYVDVLVDGRFQQELSSPTLKWKGSSNQRVIDVQASLKKKEIILYEKELVAV